MTGKLAEMVLCSQASLAIQCRDVDRTTHRVQSDRYAMLVASVGQGLYEGSRATGVFQRSIIIITDVFWRRKLKR